MSEVVYFDQGADDTIVVRKIVMDFIDRRSAKTTHLVRGLFAQSTLPSFSVLPNAQHEHERPNSLQTSTRVEEQKKPEKVRTPRWQGIRP